MFQFILYLERKFLYRDFQLTVTFNVTFYPVSITTFPIVTDFTHTLESPIPEGWFDSFNFTLDDSQN